tara:strand:+ start:139 stop:429 length:291 start_codon:yes stop_codon:yes gene_type:complete
MEYYNLQQVCVVFNDVVFFDDGTRGHINTEIYKIPKRLNFSDMYTLQTYRPDLSFDTLKIYSKRNNNNNKKLQVDPLLKYNKNTTLDFWFKRIKDS